MNLMHASDSIGWKHGASETHGGHYVNDTFVICNATGGENNYLYNLFPSTLYGTASTFSVSFDFMIDSNSACSDGLTFWFFTSSLHGLGTAAKEGGNLGFPDTVSGYALAFRTIGCVDEIYMKKINSNSYMWSSGMGPDTNICPRLTSQMFLTDAHWHHCIVNYDHGYITTSFDGGNVVMNGYSPIYGTGHFGFMATNGAGHSRKRLKNIQVCAGLGVPAFAADSFGTDINRQCNGPAIFTSIRSYSPAKYMITHYGDGTHDSTGFSVGMTGGYVMYAHNYAAPGNYTIKQRLYQAGTLIDSLSFRYENIFCATLPVKFFYDANGDCQYQPTEPAISGVVRTRVDSNGVPIDTISSTGGFYYTTHGSIGDIYSFHVLSAPGLVATCPSGGVVYDSLVPGVYIYPIKYFGMTCATGSSVDLSVYASIPVTGVHDQWGNIYVQNNYCMPAGATLTMHYSPDYNGTPSQITPTASSVAGNTITWNLSSLTSTAPGPVKLHYQANYLSTPLPIADTVYSSFTVASTGGTDTDPTNNTEVILDTVKAGCDPNELWVIPACYTSGATANQYEYKINFENTGNDTAHNIYVMDTISDYLDISTFNLVMTTNEMYVSKYKDGAGRNIIKFDFPGINLLDSSHHNACDGGLIYKIKSRAGLVSGTNIVAKAGIYFDVNDVVMTNAANSFIGCTPVPSLNVPGGTAGAVRIFPNPAGNMITIQGAGNYSSYVIANEVGQTELQQPITGNSTQVDISSLAPGLYFIRLMGAQGAEVLKFVKE